MSSCPAEGAPALEAHQQPGVPRDLFALIYLKMVHSCLRSNLLQWGTVLTFPLLYRVAILALTTL